MNLTTRFSISADVRAREVGDEIVLLDLSSGTYFGLDGIGSRIWRLVEEGKSLTEICDVLFDDFEVSREELESDARLLADELVGRGLISSA